MLPERKNQISPLELLSPAISYHNKMSKGKEKQISDIITLNFSWLYSPEAWHLLRRGKKKNERLENLLNHLYFSATASSSRTSPPARARAASGAAPWWGPCPALQHHLICGTVQHGVAINITVITSCGFQGAPSALPGQDRRRSQQCPCLAARWGSQCPVRASLGG